MSKKLLVRGFVAAVAALGLLSPAVASAATPVVPQIKQVGATVLVYRGPQLDMVLSYKYAKYHPTGSWLLLDTAMMSANGIIEVPRSAISVRTPAGEVVPMASEEAFLQGYSVLSPEILHANATADPLAYLVPQRYRRLPYFAKLGRRLAYSSAWLDEWHNDIGRLFFELPGTVQRGTYELLIDLPNGQVTIPFTL
jgi:hypothetical protein